MNEPDHTNLKVGDLLACDYRLDGGVRLHKIERVTPTQYVLANGRRVRRDDLGIIGYSAYGPFRMRVPTAQDFMVVRIREAKAALASIEVTECNIAAIEALLERREEPK